MWKKVAMLLPLTDRFRFLISAHTFLPEHHRQQFAVTAIGLQPARFEMSGQVVPEIINQDIGAQTEVGEIGDDHSVLRLVRMSFSNPILIQP